MTGIRGGAMAVTALTAVLCWPSTASAVNRTVGPGKQYAKPCAAFAAASDGDVIQIDGGTYAGDVCFITKNGLRITGVGGRPQIDAAGQNAQGKAIWVISGNDTTVENVEFSGAAVPDKNGAGIRQEGANLTVRNCVFRDNENGILAGDNANSHIVIEHTEFDHNGAGDGYSHNLYVNHVARLTFRYNWSHRAVIGHLLKTRAAENHILYNRLTGETGTQSYEIDVPNGGRTYVIGNLVQQGSTTDNPSLLAYQQEGVHASNPQHDLYVVNNTFVNDRSAGGTFVAVGGSVTTPAVLTNNVFAGTGTVTNQGTATQRNNLTSSACFLNAAAFDYRLKEGTPCIDAGAAPGSGGGMDLTPESVYSHPAAMAARAVDGTLDVGAYEYGDTPDGGGVPGGSGGAAGGDGGASAFGGALASGGTSAGGATSTGGASATGGRTSTGGARSTGGTVTGSGAASSSGGATPADAGSSAPPPKDDGCDCRLAERDATSSHSGLAAVAACLAIAGVRRRWR